MKKVTSEDRKIVVHIISEMFKDNPGAVWAFKTNKDKKKLLEKMGDYAFNKGFLRDGVMISSNEKGFAICYKFNKKVNFIKDFLNDLKFALTVVKFSKLFKGLRIEKLKKSKRPKSGEYLYFWFLGVIPSGIEPIIELRNEIYNQSKIQNLPIYLETSIERNKVMYERYGFKVEEYWEDKSENLQFWFMKMEPYSK